MAGNYIVTGKPSKLVVMVDGNKLELTLSLDGVGIRQLVPDDPALTHKWSLTEVRDAALKQEMLLRR